ncbi:hypothetical protein J7T55_008965 [Diaporthe amygdali]|uniref:uncharacterized protein n=1 Tax=Phomopsis amygdali TaxID=1214568 RepID=UPI0022FE1A46|nr:uncharacterized protein J7T55_008965 [Diaporthe amygdali]KAJ0121798.1 hypothetical protein J7T55_008965 [Diaporthe amygdali]
MPGRKRAAADDGDSSEDEINVDQVIRTKVELGKIRKDREKKRAQIKADLDKKLDGLRVRVERSVTAHTKQLGNVHKQQVDQLLQAIEARDNILQDIGEKLSEMQDKGFNLATHLDQAYEYRMKKLERLAMPVKDQRVRGNDRTKSDAA